VGSYVLGRELGKGAMATVYEARHDKLGKRVALKLMHAHLAADGVAAARFLREGKAAAQIHNPHVVDVFDVGVHEGVPFLVMELLDGADVAATLRERVKLPLPELCDLMIPVASAVQAAHAVGVIHRDLKPSNVMLAGREGAASSPTILDFGISRVENDALEQNLTASEVLLGTVHYMSPEQTRGGRNASPRSDQYALGVMLYECATGVKPFSGNSPYSLMHAIVTAKVPPPSTLDPALPPEFDEVVLRAMHRDPARRFGSVRELGARLFAWASEDVRARWAGEFGVDVAALRGRSRSPRGARIVLFAIGSGVVLAAGLALRLAGRSSPASAAPVPISISAIASSAPEPSAQVAPPIVTALEVPAEPAASLAEGTPATASTRAAPPRPSAHGPYPLPGRPSPAVAPSASAPERGTNGAPIVE
jgi:serine/threonine-protein kinase